ncbi:unnamed protein product [Amoebophrya sp. A120]|nr:unnamed protein product [Amoebophrya sp. A120]|eukprot:GSA120T00015545001.1
MTVPAVGPPASASASTTMTTGARNYNPEVDLIHDDVEQEELQDHGVGVAGSISADPPPRRASKPELSSVDSSSPDRVDSSADQEQGHALLDAALVKKGEGNELYKNHEFKAANQKWTEALKDVLQAGQFILLPRSATELETALYLNLAQGHLKLSEWKQAEKALFIVLREDKSNAKAWFRLGEAQLGMEQSSSYEDVKKTILKLVDLGNKPLATSLQAKLKEKKEKEKDVYRKIMKNADQFAVDEAELEERKGKATEGITLPSAATANSVSFEQTSALHDSIRNPTVLQYGYRKHYADQRTTAPLLEVGKGHEVQETSSTIQERAVGAQVEANKTGSGADHDNDESTPTAVQKTFLDRALQQAKRYQKFSRKSSKENIQHQAKLFYLRQGLEGSQVAKDYEMFAQGVEQELEARKREGTEDQEVCELDEVL